MILWTDIDFEAILGCFFKLNPGKKSVPNSSLCVYLVNGLSIDSLIDSLVFSGISICYCVDLRQRVTIGGLFSPATLYRCISTFIFNPWHLKGSHK